MFSQHPPLLTWFPPTKNHFARAPLTARRGLLHPANFHRQLPTLLPFRFLAALPILSIFESFSCSSLTLLVRLPPFCDGLYRGRQRGALSATKALLFSRHRPPARTDRSGLQPSPPPLPSLQWSTVRSFPPCSPAQSARFLNSPPLAPKVPLLHLVR